MSHNAYSRNESIGENLILCLADCMIIQELHLLICKKICALLENGSFTNFDRNESFGDIVHN